MSIVRIINCSLGGKMLINLSRISTAHLKDKNIHLSFSEDQYSNKATINYDTHDEAEEALKTIQKELNKYYKLN